MLYSVLSKPFQHTALTVVMIDIVFVQVFLYDCIVHGVLLSLNKDNSKHFASDNVQSYPQHSLMHPLLQVLV